MSESLKHEKMMNKRSIDALVSLFVRMPWDISFDLPDGTRGYIRSFCEPETTEEGVAYFGFDIEFEDGSSLEFQVEQSSWAPPQKDYNLTQS